MNSVTILGSPSTSFDNLQNKDKETHSVVHELTAQLATQLNTAEYDKANKPASVVNLPIKADSDEKLETSSDGRNDDIFPQDYFAAPLKYFRLLPKEEKIHKGSKTIIRRNQQSGEILSPLSTSAIHPPDIWQEYNAKTQSWEKIQYIRIRKFYRQLIKHNKEEAKLFRSTLEKSHGHRVPYREVRETINHNKNAQSLERAVRTINPARSTFLGFFDSVTKKSSPQIGYATFSAFDLAQQKDLNIQNASTGHAASQPDNTLLETGKAFDLWIRHCTAELIKQSIYNPETSRAPVDTKDNKILLWRLADFQTIRDINQSHYLSQNWAVNVLRAFVIPAQITIIVPNNRQITITDQKVISDMLISLISRIFTAFDPIAIAERQFHAGEVISFQRCLIHVMQNYANSEFTLQAETRDYEKMRTGKKNVDKAKNVSDIWQYIDSLNTIDSLVQVLHLMLSDSPQNTINAQLIVSAAQSSNRKIAGTIDERFSLDYEEFSYNLLISFFKELELVSEGEPDNELYQMILHNTILDHKEHALGLISAMKTPKRSIFNTLPLHWAAITGNTTVIEWLRSNSELSTVKWLGDITETADGKILPLHLAIRHCRYHGNNLQLLHLLCNEDIIDTKTENDLSLCDMIINELDDPLPVLDSFLEKYEEDMSIDPDNLEKDLGELIIEAIEEGYDDVADFLIEHFGDELSLIYEEIEATLPDVNDKLIEWLRENDPEFEENIQEVFNNMDETEETLSDKNSEVDSDETETMSDREFNDDDFANDIDEEHQQDEFSDQFDYDSEPEIDHEIEQQSDDIEDTDDDHRQKESSNKSEIEPKSLSDCDADTKTESIANLLALMNINAEERNRAKQSKADTETAADVTKDTQCDNAGDDNEDIHNKRMEPATNLEVDLDNENLMLDDHESVARFRY